MEYLDSPELSLSTLQVGSLLELDEPATRELLQASITTGLLDQTQEGYFVLADHYQSGPTPNVFTSNDEQ